VDAALASYLLEGPAPLGPSDSVAGNHGEEVLVGGAGQDLLIGSFGHDQPLPGVDDIGINGTVHSELDTFFESLGDTMRESDGDR
jgi:hypothetical protein